MERSSFNVELISYQVVFPSLVTLIFRAFWRCAVNVRLRGWSWLSAFVSLFFRAGEGGGYTWIRGWSWLNRFVIFFLSLFRGPEGRGRGTGFFYKRLAVEGG